MDDLLRDRVRLQVHDRRAVLTLARGSRGNALDREAAHALSEAAHRCAARSDLRVVTLRAEGAAFCVGGDLSAIARAEDVSSYVLDVASRIHEAMTVLEEHPAVLITVVHGVAAGGGMGLALWGDLVLAGRSARFRAGYTAAGLSPDCGVSVRLAQALGSAVALDVLLTNRELSASEAHRWGLVSRVVEDLELEAVAHQVAGDLAAGSAPSLVATRALLRSASTTPWPEQLAQEAATIARLAGSPDGREGVAAFVGKRLPSFASTGHESAGAP
jgi:2-(1,2-epoxy-1,2-dihydrophenyl)acetyl-CoA isomerase